MTLCHSPCTGDEATFAATYTETAAVANDGSMLYASNVEVSATVTDAVTGEAATVVVSQTEYAAGGATAHDWSGQQWHACDAEPAGSCASVT